MACAPVGMAPSISAIRKPARLVWNMQPFRSTVGLEPWLRAKLALTSKKSKLAEAIRYALSRWGGPDPLPR